MKNGFVLLAVAVSLAGFAGMMRIKTDVQTLSRERLRLAKEQMELRETKRVLEAEWAHLANPLRLQKFSETRDYVPLGMQDVLVLAPKPQAVMGDAVAGGALWRRALQRVAPVSSTVQPAKAPESVMDALELPDDASDTVPVGGMD